MDRHLLFVAFATLCIIGYCNASCGGTFTGVAGTISSDEYVANMYCIYTIAPPSNEYTFVQITFNSLSTEYGYDYVTVYNGPSNNSEVLSTFSGWRIPPTFYSTQPYMTIVFETDEYINLSGWTFSFQYLTTPAPSCAGPKWYPDSYGNILLNITGNAATSVFCEYIISPEPILYDDWSYNCQSEVYLTLYSWIDSTSTASLDAYAGSSMYAPWAGSFSGSSWTYDQISVSQQQNGEVYLRYSVSTSPSSHSSFWVYYSQLSTCDTSGSSDHHNTAHFLVWFVPLLGALVCFTCVVVSIAYRSSKNRQRQQTTQYQNLAVPMQSMPQNQQPSSVPPPSFHPMPGSYPPVSQANPYAQPVAPVNVYYPPYNPMYGAPVTQPAPGLFPTNTAIHTLQPPVVPLQED